jgi:hypothetical protein
MNLFEFFRFHQERLQGGVKISKFEIMAECCCELLDDIREKDFQGFFTQTEIYSFEQEAIDPIKHPLSQNQNDGAFY